MTDQQINAAIAEACGWKDVWRPQDASETASFVGTSPDHKFLPVPNYCADLNAMHEAEAYLTENTTMLDYTNELYDVACADLDKPKIWNPYGATARQRAEAFLRTLGKWQEASA